MQTDKSWLELIPMPAKVLAGCTFAVFFTFMSFFLNGQQAFGWGTIVGTVAGTLLAGTILLAGYVYADAGRRGMPPGLWTALAVLVPNGIGFVLYFLLRKPLVCQCPSCGRNVAMDCSFCPACGRAMGPGTNASGAAQTV